MSCAPMSSVIDGNAFSAILSALTCPKSDVNKRNISESDDNMRTFAGLDAHKKHTEVAIVDIEGVTEKQERIENEPGRIEEFSNMLSKADVVLESSSSRDRLYEILSRRHRVVLSNPAKTKATASAKLKTDKVGLHHSESSLAKNDRVGEFCGLTHPTKFPTPNVFIVPTQQSHGATKQFPFARRSNPPY